MPPQTFTSEDRLFEARLFLEEVVCDLCRLREAREQQVPPAAVEVRQDVRLGKDAFAHVLVRVPGRTSYLVEVDYGYSAGRITRSVLRKYGKPHPLLDEVEKLVVIVDDAVDEQRVRHAVVPGLPSAWELEIWNEQTLRSLLHKELGVAETFATAPPLADLRESLDHARGTYAFGEHYSNEPLDGSLLSALGFWRLRELFEAAERKKQAILRPDSYEGVVVVFADLSGFSSYVRDTPDTKVIQESLGAFCAKSRLQILNHGGMLLQYLGDAVIGLFGIPDQTQGYEQRGFECAKSLLMLGDKISHAWQRELDRVQQVRGAHIGMAVGDLQAIALRPLSRTHFGAIGDAINLAARLSSHAEPGQIALSNALYRSLPHPSRSALTRSEPIDAKNVGRIQAWIFDENRPAPPG